MARTLIVLGLAALGAASSRRRGSGGGDCGNNNSPFGAAGDFEEFELALSCPASFCAKNSRSSGSLECSGNYPYLILHGLWPNYDPNREDSGCVHGWPQFCPTQYTDTSDDSLLATLNSVYPDWQTIAPEYGTLIGHEWARHGTCSGLSPADYFTLAFKSAASAIQSVTCSSDCSFKLTPDGTIKNPDACFPQRDL